MENNCLFCGEKLVGRADKKFCDSSCRNSYNNQKNADINKTMRSITHQLRKNRRILASLLPKGENTKKVQKDFLLKKGFNFQYFTHIYTTKKGHQYFYVFDMGYLALDDQWLLIVQKD